MVLVQADSKLDLRPAIDCDDVHLHKDTCARCCMTFDCSREHAGSAICDVCRLGVISERVLR